MSRKLVKFKILTAPYQHGRVYKAKALKDTLDIVSVFISSDDPQRYLTRLQRGMNYLVRKETQPSAKIITIKDSMRIFTTYGFDVPKDIEAAYYEAKVVMVQEAHASKKTRRLSLKGVIQNLSPIELIDTCPRREFDLEEPETSSTIKCKVWGNACTNPLPEGAHATFTNLETSVFKGTVQVNTTQETEIILTEGDQTKTCRFTGYDPDEVDNMTELMSIDGASYGFYMAPTDLIVEAIQADNIHALQPLLPLRCTITYTPATATIKTIRCAQI